MAVFQDDKKTRDGRIWYFSTYYSNIDGTKKRYKSKKYSTKKEALEQERIFLLTLTDKVKNKDLIFEDLVNEYVIFQKDKVKISSFNNYNKHIQKIKYFFKLKCDDINIQKFNQWKIKINETNYSTRYKNNIYKFFRAILNYGMKYHDIDFRSLLNKMTGFTNPNELKKEISFWTYDEFSLFIEKVDELKYKCYYETLYYCGLRKSEANALNWKDIDFDNNTISISKSLTLQIKGLEYIILPPKTKSSIRILPMPNVLKKDLNILLNEYKKYSNFSNNWFVFGGISPLKDTTVTTKKNEYCKKANVKEIRIHDFRHSTASLLISNGASISLVAKYLGHSNITTTLNTYTHMFKTEMNDIINIINKL